MLFGVHVPGCFSEIDRSLEAEVVGQAVSTFLTGIGCARAGSDTASGLESWEHGPTAVAELTVLHECPQLRPEPEETVRAPFGPARREDFHRRALLTVELQTAGCKVTRPLVTEDKTSWKPKNGTPSWSNKHDGVEDGFEGFFQGATTGGGNRNRG